MPPAPAVHTWHKLHPTAGDLLVSTSVSLLDRAWINDAFATQDMYWAKRLPTDQLELLLQHSTTLGMYKVLPPAGVRAVKEMDGEPSSPRTPSPTLEPELDVEAEATIEQIGVARLITDHVTFQYLTDVYLLPEYRTSGLGKWLVACCREVMDATPELRRSLLFTSPEVGRRFYERELGWWDVRDEQGLGCMTFRGWGFGEGGEKGS